MSRGPVAQLGARFHGMEEVVGSIPTRSTNNHSDISDLRCDTPCGYASRLVPIGANLVLFRAGRRWRLARNFAAILAISVAALLGLHRGSNPDIHGTEILTHWFAILSVIRLSADYRLRPSGIAF